MTSPDRRHGNVFFRLGFVLVLVSGAMGYTVGAKGAGPIPIGILGRTVDVPPGPGLASASMVLAASVLGALFTASTIAAGPPSED